MTTNSTLVVNFVQGDGGIGDIIKFYLHFAYICNTITNSDIKVSFEEKYKTVQKYLIFDKELLKLPNPSHTVTRVRISDFYRKGIDKVHELAMNTNYHNWENIPDVASEYRKIANNSFGFSPLVMSNYKKRLSVLKITQGEYVCFHLRQGDSSLESVPQRGHCSGDSRVNKIGIDNIIETMKETSRTLEGGFPVILLCDNSNIRTKIQNLIPTLLCIENSNPIHIAYEDFKTPLADKERDFEDTFSDFVMLIESKRNYAFSYSGFSIISSFLGDVPMTKLY